MKLEKILPHGSKRREVLKKIYYKFFQKYSKEERIYKKWIEKMNPISKN